MRLASLRRRQLITQRGELLSAASSDDLGTAIECAIEATEADLVGATLAVNASLEGADVAKIDSVRFATFVAPSFY